MALTTGSRLGPYQITAAIGAGGMGEVYKATDTRLDRSVAIKVLPDHVAGDPELKQRFEREAKTLAALSHPHICPVFDESGQFEVYVRSFPASNDQKKVSVAGGTQPEWRRDGRELFYISPDRKLMAVTVAMDKGAVELGVTKALFDVDMPEVSAPYPTEYAVSTDGQRFLVNTIIEQTSRPPLTIVLNWHDELRARTRSN
jgi:serine/threonine protein kinase